MRAKRAALVAAAILLSASASPRAADCLPTQAAAVRIDYEALMPMYAVAMAPRSEVERVFPQVRGVVSRTVYVTPEKYVEIERGQALESNVVAPGATAPGVHLGDGKGNLMKWIGYEQVPLTLMRIETRTEALSFSSLQGTAKYERRGPPDADTSRFLNFLESDLPRIGTQRYAGTECIAKRMPTLGAQTEACVLMIHDWPVALHLQLPNDGTPSNWYKATRMDRNACVPRADLELPRGTKIEDER